MKKSLLTGMALMSLLTVGAQQQQAVIDLRTGIYEVPPINFPTQMPIGTVDDTWHVYKYVGGGFQSLLPAYVSNGHELYFTSSCYPGQNASNWQCSYQSIDPEVGVISPYICQADIPDPSNPPGFPNIQDFGDLTGGGGPNAEYLYRTTFDFGKNCNTTMQSAFLNLKILTGDGVMGMYLNGHSISLPNYPSIPTNIYSSFPDYLQIDNAMSAGNNYNNQYPYTINSWNGPLATAIPFVSVPIPLGYFSNGSNTLVIVLNPSAHMNKKTAALIVDADITINYFQGVQPFTVSPNGPVTLIQTATQQQSITISATCSVPSYMQIVPGNTSGNGPGTISATYTPMVSTNYFVKVVQPALGCGDMIKIPVTVLQQRPSLWASLDLRNSTERLLSGSAGVIKPLIDDPNAAAFHVKVQKEFNGDPIYEGVPNVNVEVTPQETNDYIITVTDPDGFEYVQVWNIEVYPPDMFANNGGSRLANPQTTNTTAFAVQVSPNPSNGVFALTTSLPSNGTVQVFDVNGKQIYQAQLNATSTTHSVDLTAFASGIYMLIVNSDQGHFETKLLRD